MTFAKIIKVNIWATEDIDWDFLCTRSEVLFGDTYPSMPIGYIKALGLPEIKNGIEIWAAKELKDSNQSQTNSFCKFVVYSNKYGKEQENRSRRKRNLNHS
jgi:hypothetical protein